MLDMMQAMLHLTDSNANKISKQNKSFEEVPVSAQARV